MSGPTVAVTGASGFVGTALVSALEAEGSRVLRLVRRDSTASNEVAWDPEGDRIDSARLEGVDAVVHLAGESIATSRWSAERKRRIRESRARGTTLLARALAGLAVKPRVLVSASGVGFYGDRGDDELTEADAQGTGFLAEVAAAWEAAADPARDAGIRVVHPRLSLVLHPNGGALEKMLPPFRLGLGGQLGHGRQWMSWCSLDDVVGIIRAAMADERMSGPVNAVSPNPVRNAEFTRLLGAALHRPAIAAVPAKVLELMFGELAKEALLVSQRAIPARLLALGYAFRDPELGPTLVKQLSH